MEGARSVFNDLRDGRVEFAKHGAGRYAQHAETIFMKKDIAISIILRTLPEFVYRSIDFDYQFGDGAKEIDHIGADWMLATKS